MVNLPYTPSTDIREQVSYLDVMKKYNLGPNGAIITSLNLWCAGKLGQFIEDVDTADYEYLLVDTPGQIEVFTQSSSGSLITSALSKTMNTILLFVVDAPKCLPAQLSQFLSKSTKSLGSFDELSRDAGGLVTFMSNLLYACCMVYRLYGAPIILVLNKADQCAGKWPSELHEKPDPRDEDESLGFISGENLTHVLVEMMRDYDFLQQFVSPENEYESNDLGYTQSLMLSLSTVLEEFYENFKVVACSSIDLALESNWKNVGLAKSGGMEALWKAIDESAISLTQSLNASNTKASSPVSTTNHDALTKSQNSQLDKFLKDKLSISEKADR